MMQIPIVVFVLLIVAIFAAFIGGFFVARKLITKQIEENPPFSREQIKAMYLSMGVKPSEARINQTMNAIQRAGKNNQKK